MRADATEKVLHFLTWANYIPEEVITDFEKKTGIQVKFSYFDGSSMLRAKLFSGDDNFDVITPDIVDIAELKKAGLLRPIDHAQLEHWAERDQSIYDKIAEIDPGNAYAAIYSYGTTGIAMNEAMVKKALGMDDLGVVDWGILLDPENLKKLSSCGVSFVDEPIQIFGITLHYLGLDPNSERPEDYEKAAEHLMKLRPYLTYFSNDLYLQDLAAGNICIGMIYSGDLVRAKNLSAEAFIDLPLKYVLPAKGTSIWFDTLAVPEKAPHPVAAMQFLNYMIAPETALKVTRAIYQPTGFSFAPGSVGSQELEESIQLDQDELKRLFIIQTKDAKIRALMQKLWLRVKYGI
jgi:putrescine transport system substrate-binding protein